MLNGNAEFWALVSNALHTSVFVTLHRLLDDASAGNVYAVLNCARSNAEMFSRSALAARQGGPAAQAAQWSAEGHEATADDFKRLESEIRRRVAAGTPAQHEVIKHTERVMQSLRDNR